MAIIKDLNTLFVTGVQAHYKVFGEETIALQYNIFLMYFLNSVSQMNFHEEERALLIDAIKPVLSTLNHYEIHAREKRSGRERMTREAQAFVMITNIEQGNRWKAACGR